MRVHSFSFAGKATEEWVGVGGGPLRVPHNYWNPLGDYVEGDDTGAVAASFADSRRLRKVERAVLVPADAILVAGIPTVRVALAATTAINDWTIDRWLAADPAFYGVVLVATQDPQHAAREIRRVGGHRQMAGVLMGAAGLGKPFGHSVYDPIYEAAAEYDLPILILPGAEEAVDAGAQLAGGGPPSTYIEMRALAHQSLESHAASLISQGVPARYPRLRVLLLGGGMGWVTPWLWSMDTNYKSFSNDALWLRDSSPSEVFRQYFSVGTYPFSFAAQPDRLQRYLEVDPALADVVCYASGYPAWDSSNAVELAERIPDGWRDRVMHDNASRLFGWNRGSIE
jgi:predicted TIM-barrel fold metal-dependent hydrolase